MSHEPLTITNIIRAAALPFLAGAVTASLCWLACGVTLGLFFGGTAMLVILLPPLAGRHDHPIDALITAGSLIDGIAVVWLVALIGTSLLQWLQAYLVLIAVGIALLGMLILLRRMIGSTAAAAMTTIVFIAWLAWSVWLSPWVRAGAVAWLAPAHPLFALNRVFIDHGIWTQQPLMYQLTTLGQDVPYALPSSIFACAFAHTLIALALGLPAWWSAHPAESPAPPSAASPAA